MTWPIEEIPNADLLFMRALAVYVVAGRIQPGCFVAHGSGMSVDWAKYASPLQTRARAQRKPPSAYGVVSLVAGDVRKVEGLRVEHAPTENRAHTEIRGAITDPDVDRARVREELVRIATLAIDPTEQVL